LYLEELRESRFVVIGAIKGSLYFTIMLLSVRYVTLLFTRQKMALTSAKMGMSLIPHLDILKGKYFRLLE
jgi:hypothetical protein